MGSEFDRQFAAVGTPKLMDQFGVPITYSTSDGLTETSLTAIVTEEEIEPADVETGKVARRVRYAEINLDPTNADGGVAEPAIKAIVTLGEVTYRVTAIPDIGDYTATLELSRSETTEVSRKRYRGA